MMVICVVLTLNHNDDGGLANNWLLKEVYDNWTYMVTVVVLMMV